MWHPPSTGAFSVFIDAGTESVECSSREICILVISLVGTQSLSIRIQCVIGYTPSSP